MDYSTVKYLHVVRLGKEEVEGFLNSSGDIYVFPKLDGTNAIVWADEDGNLYAGSRNRQLDEDNDNANFCKHALHSDEMKPIREFCIGHPGKVVCGEWLGAKANIKDYLIRAFWVFDVKDKSVNQEQVVRHSGYHPYTEYSEWLSDYPYIVPPLAVFHDGNHPTLDDLKRIMDDNHFNLPENVVGEGIVLKNYDYISPWGNYEVAKLVRDEFLVSKGKKKTVNIDENAVEPTIVEDFVSASDIEKAKAKVEIALGREFSKNDGKMIGMTLEMVYNDLLTEEIVSIAKKYGKYPIKFQAIKNLTYIKTRKVLGLV